MFAFNQIIIINDSILKLYTFYNFELTVIYCLLITGITKSTTKKVTQSAHKISSLKMSNLIYLPITYLSNAKPFKVMINSLGKT